MTDTDSAYLVIECIREIMGQKPLNQKNESRGGKEVDSEELEYLNSIIEK